MSINFDSKKRTPIKETLEFELYLDSWKKFTLTQTGAMRCESSERVATGLRRISWETIGSYAQAGGALNNGWWPAPSLYFLTAFAA